MRHSSVWSSTTHIPMPQVGYRTSRNHSEDCVDMNKEILSHTEDELKGRDELALYCCLGVIVHVKKNS